MVEAIIGLFFLLAFALVLSGAKVDVEDHHALELARFNNATRAACFIVLVFAIVVMALNSGDMR